jgi:hypothetical protein
MNVTIIGARNMGRGIAFSGTLVGGQRWQANRSMCSSPGTTRRRRRRWRSSCARGVAGHRRRSSGACEAAGGPRVPRDYAAAAAGAELPECLEAHKLGGGWPYSPKYLEVRNSQKFA